MQMDFAARRDKLRRKLAEEKLPAMLVSLAANRYWLSGFELHDPQCNESAGMLLITRDGRDKLLTDPRYLDMARRLWAADDIFIYTAPKLKTIAAFLNGLGYAEIGFEPEAMCWATWDGLANEGVSLKPVKNLVERLRVIKEPAEIAAMRRSCALNHKVFAATPDVLVPGRSEAEVAWELEKLFRDGGASELSFATIVGVGPNAALPHAIPGSVKVRENELVLVDMGCRLDDYCSDQTRTFWVGAEPSARFRETVERVREAQENAIKALRPGLPCASAYQTARAVLERHGVAQYFTHGLGHGIGLETHEAPSLSPASEDKLAPGMVVTVEPGLYHPEWGGVRWEYMALITEDGAEIF